MACEEEGRSPTSAERDAGLGKGYLSRMIYGDRGNVSFNAEHMRSLARLLHVNFEWLVIGEGPMRRDGRGVTPAEMAIRFAREQGAREDAITEAWKRNKDRESEMTATDWLLAIDTEARRLERSGVPRPEKVAKEVDQILRAKRRLETAKQRRTEKEAGHETTVARTRRAAGDGM